MPLIFETFEQLNEQARAELRRRIPSIDPTVFGSFSNAMLSSASTLAYSNNLTIRDLTVQLFPQTSQGEFLDRWGNYEDLEQTPPSAAQGLACVAGTVGTSIPFNTIYTGPNGLDYRVETTAVIQTVSQSISTLTRSGTVVTATMSADHTLASGLSVTVSGAVETEYNGTFSITVISRNQFTYEISTTPTSPATGTISYSSNFASVNLICQETGQQTNLGGGSILNVESTITGADDTAISQIDGISGGADLESEEAYRRRILLSRSIIEGVYTPEQVELAALGIAGNTRAFVVTPTLSVADANPSPGDQPSPGQTFVYILRDNDANIIPTQTVLNNTKQAIIENGALPANSSEADLFVFAPNTVSVDFTFSALTPDTPTMRTAVQNQLIAFFEDKVDFEQDVLQAAYLGEIQNTQDLTTGKFIQSFALSYPTGNVTINAGEIAILGDITFP